VSADTTHETDTLIATPQDPESPAKVAWSMAAVERFDLGDRAVEALIYGEDWKTAPRVLIALHGGPESAWKAEFDPILQEFAAADITVIAPNQRGSTGYGPEHQQAIHHAWGGPDLADIHDLADHISARRAASRDRRPRAEESLMLFGVSYGAFLALLAAATRPELWSHCVASSPFLSGDRLHRDATPPVRRLLDRLGGSTQVIDHIGPRDLAILSRHIRTRTLIVHGSADATVPVSHARGLHRRLSDEGHCPDLQYLEVRGAGHSPLTEAGGPRLVQRIATFLTDRGPR
jgi:dipeptidyl aminopeptidase/acylaminoacyl peptidase